MQRGSGDRLSIRDDISNTGVRISERIQVKLCHSEFVLEVIDGVCVCVCVPYPFGSSTTASAQSCFLVCEIQCDSSKGFP